MTSSPMIALRRGLPAELVELSESDICDIAGFVAAQSGRPRETVESHLRWFLLENPARQLHDPLGFGLRSGEQLVGCILCSPQDFIFQGKKNRFMGSSLFYVDEFHRGQGGRLFLQYCRLGRRWPLFGTSANADAAALWRAAGASPIPGSDGELFGVIRWRPVIEEIAHRKNINRFLTRLASSSVSGVARLMRPLTLDRAAPDALRLLTSAEEVNNLSIHHASNKLTAMRDLPYIRWRYFTGRDPTVAAFAFRKHTLDREILVTVNQRTRGYRAQINTLNVLDVYPEASVEDWLQIVGSLIARYAKIIDAVVLRNQNDQRHKAFCPRGFRLRTFDAPIGWFLDKAKILPTYDWYPVPADGDGLI